MPESLIRRLGTRLARPLPGRAAVRAYAPELAYGRHSGPAPHDARPAAVLVLLYEHQQEWHVPLTLRSRSVPAHAGQVSFPGGMIEPGETPELAALRELQEEIGVAPEFVTLLGRLSPVYVFGTNFLVTPIVASAGARPAFQMQAREVAAIIEAPVRELAHPAQRGSQELEREGVRFRAPFVVCQREPIWGATCLILAEFLAVLQEINVL